MNKKPRNEGNGAAGSPGVGPMIPETPDSRTHEGDADPKEKVLESAPESERWDPLPGSAGHQAPESPSEDEDDEGRSETEQLVEGGVEAAGRDQMLQATKEEAKKNK